MAGLLLESLSQTGCLFQPELDWLLQIENLWWWQVELQVLDWLLRKDSLCLHLVELRVLDSLIRTSLQWELLVE
jgi:hypothetical protein